ncbi:MAG: FAD-binding protein, partial [Planctomycetaceae bacterium]|nr:FAD-binding protein [Planctomycetaceae bacterium]
GGVGRSGASAVSMSVHRFATGAEAPGEYERYMTESGAGVNLPRRVAALVAGMPSIPGAVRELFPEVVVRTTTKNGRTLPAFVSAPTKQGGAMVRAARSVLLARPEIAFLEGVTIAHLQPLSGGGLLAWFLQDGELVRVAAGAVVLATGGFPGLYLRQSATPELLGGGLGLALRLGLTLVDMEFFQFYPYRIFSPRICDIFPDIFAHGAKFLSVDGHRFMERFPRKELETRDVLAREIFRLGTVRLDLSEADCDFLARETPRLLRLWDAHPDEPLLVRPHAHYSMGGIAVRNDGGTRVDGVFAAGEVCGGVHGANRLAGHALAETAVCGRQAGAAAARYASDWRPPETYPDDPPSWLPMPGNGDATPLLERLRETMWNDVGLVRTAEGLARAAASVEAVAADLGAMRPADPVLWLIARDGAAIARTVIEAAARRTESRGAHWRDDYPDTDPSLCGNIYHRDGNMWFEPRAESM